MELDHPGHEALERRGGRILGRDHHEVHDHEHQHHDDQRVDGRSGTRPDGRHQRRSGAPYASAGTTRAPNASGTGSSDARRVTVRSDPSTKTPASIHSRGASAASLSARDHGSAEAARHRSATAPTPQSSTIPSRAALPPPPRTTDDRRTARIPSGQRRGEQRRHGWEGTPIGPSCDSVRQPGHRDERSRQDQEEGEHIQRRLGILPLARAERRDWHRLGRRHDDRHRSGEAGTRERDREHKSGDKRRTHRTTAQLRPLTTPFG